MVHVHSPYPRPPPIPTLNAHHALFPANDEKGEDYVLVVVNEKRGFGRHRPHLG